MTDMYLHFLLFVSSVAEDWDDMCPANLILVHIAIVTVTVTVVQQVGYWFYYLAIAETFLTTFKSLLL